MEYFWWGLASVIPFCLSTLTTYWQDGDGFWFLTQVHSFWEDKTIISEFTPFYQVTLDSKLPGPYLETLSPPPIRAWPPNPEVAPILPPTKHTTVSLLGLHYLPTLVGLISACSAVTWFLPAYSLPVPISEETAVSSVQIQETMKTFL